jgi:hypothetical protein
MAKLKSNMVTSEVSTLPKAKRRAITEDERRRMVAEAAYYLAEQRAFTGGDPADDWLLAEVQINRLLGPQLM